MADVQQAPIVTPDLALYTASGSPESAESASPAVAVTSPANVTVVTSGTRPLLLASSSAPAVDGVTETSPDNVQSAPVSVPPTAAATVVQINTTPSLNGGSGIVIRAAASPSMPSPPAAAATSAPAGEVAATGQIISQPIATTAAASVVSSGITIRSSASPTKAVPTAPLPTNDPPVAADATLGQPVPSLVVPVQPVLITPVSQQPQQSAAPAPAEPLPVQTLPDANAGSATHQPKAESDLQPPAAVSTSGGAGHGGVIRAPSPVGHGQKPGAAARRQEEPPITLSELFNKLDLVTVCGFLLAVMSVAFASILTGEDRSISWLMIVVAVASVVVFVRFRL